MGYRYKVCKGRTIYAIATTLREAEQEAARIGGKVLPIKTVPSRNPELMQGWVPPTEEEYARWEAEAEEENRRGREKEAARMARKMGEWGYKDSPNGTRLGDEDFPFRPEGVEAKADRKAQFKRYLFTILSPKCRIPLAIYGDPYPHVTNYYYAGFSVDRERLYAIGYEDWDELNRKGYVRQHMMPGLLCFEDMGTGLGSAMYQAGPLVTAALLDPDIPGTFSPKKFPLVTYSARTGSAVKAWENLVKHKLAKEVKEGKDIVVQQLNRQTVLDLGIVLHAATAVWPLVLDGMAPRKGMSYVPPAAGWAAIDLSDLPEKNLKEMLKFCTDNSGDRDYKAEAIEAIATNPSCPYDAATLDRLAGSRRNPAKRPNPEQQRKAAAWVKTMSDKGWE